MDSIGKSKVCAEDNQIVSPVVNPCLAMIISNLSFSFKQTYLDFLFLFLFQPKFAMTSMLMTMSILNMFSNNIHLL